LRFRSNSSSFFFCTFFLLLSLFCN
jgi:hypothetical protein